MINFADKSVYTKTTSGGERYTSAVYKLKLTLEVQ